MAWEEGLGRWLEWAAVCGSIPPRLWCVHVRAESCAPLPCRRCLEQMFIDSLPIWGFIGKVEKLPGGEEGKEGEGEEGREKLSLFTHIHFDVLYNKDRVIQVDISTGGRGGRRGWGTGCGSGQAEQLWGEPAWPGWRCRTLCLPCTLRRALHLSV